MHPASRRGGPSSGAPEPFDGVLDSPAGENTVSRDQKIAVVKAFLDCMASGELDRLPITRDLTVESPLTPKLSGAAALAYVKAVAAGTKSIRVVQHIVEANHVATLTENETVNGLLSVFSKFQIEAGRIKDVRVFYDPRQIAGAT